jgi:aspartyl protease family protein
MSPRAVLPLLCALALVGPAHAQTVVLSGILGGKALLVVDGGSPRSVAAGQSHQGVKVIATEASQVVVEINGLRQTLRLGEGPVHASPVTSEAADRRRIVLHAGSNGHFRALGQINGRAVTFMVDTGASVVSLSAAEAETIGIPYKDGPMVLLNTANGQTVGWQVKLGSVRLGSVDVYAVDALVTPSPMPYVLLGNSYLARFQMTRTNDQMVLEQRY